MGRILNLFGSFPFKTGLVLGFLCFVIVRGNPFSLRLGLGNDSVKDAEFYPLSSFPMYSKFSSKPIYVYLTDASGQPIACHTGLGVLASELKKIYDKELRIVGKREDIPVSELTPEFKTEAGIVTLRTLRENLAPDEVAKVNPGPLRLYEVEMRRGRGSEITKTTTLVGEL